MPSLPGDLPSACEREPIHTPGQIQGHGALLGLSPDDLLVREASASVLPLLGLPPEGLLGRSLPSSLLTLDGAPVAAQIGSWGAGAIWRRARWRQGGDERLLDLYSHHRGGRLLVELEPATPMTDVEAMSWDEALERAVGALQAASGLTSLCDTLVDETARLTGFDRVMVYRFDEGWNGTVIAERTAPGVGGYLGQRFPASDIPAQARALFLSTAIRTIPDVNAPASPIEPRQSASLDLGRAILRSSSPVHLEYLRNMGVAASMTASLVRDGSLWGLVGCHHGAPWHLPARVRTGCALLARIASAALAAAEEAEEAALRARVRATRERIVGRVAESDDLVSGLVEGSPSLLDLSDAGGVAAAINVEGDWRLLGRTPPPEAIEELLAWLRQAHPGFEIFSTHELPRLYPAARAYKDVASGLLAISLPKTERDVILWFRPEVPQTVRWAGDPAKPILPEGGTLHPRASFELWKEVVRETSLRWKAAELEAACDLRRAIIECDLRLQFRKERAARMARDHVLGVVSHDLRNPLGVVQMSATALERRLGAVSPDVSTSAASDLRRIDRSCRRMRSLIDDVLNVARLEAGTFTVLPTAVEVDALLAEALDMLDPLAAGKGVTLAIEGAASGARVLCDRERVLQVFSNLVGNAIKFTPAGGHVRVSTAALAPDAVTFSVRDDGPGIRAEDLPRVFDPFWQACRTGKEGAGLGLAISRGIVEAHGGRIWVESPPGAGAAFSFILPRAR